MPMVPRHVCQLPHVLNGMSVFSQDQFGMYWTIKVYVKASHVIKTLPQDTPLEENSQSHGK